jgi:diadenosine tetraphosphate (Ap4A) HIT family hydrolase
VARPPPISRSLFGAKRDGKQAGRAGFAGLVQKRGKALVAVMPTDTPAWSLHSRLKEDTIDIGDLPLCRVLVIKDAHYPWLLLVPRRHEAVEIIDLDEVEQAQLMAEITRVARALKEITKCDKLNIAALGNLVPQLHVHIIARRSSDVAWPRPVWGVMPPLPHDAEEVQNFISALRRKIWLG